MFFLTFPKPEKNSKVLVMSLAVLRKSGERSTLGMLRFGKKSAQFLRHPFRLAASIGIA